MTALTNETGAAGDPLLAAQKGSIVYLTCEEDALQLIGEAFQRAFTHPDLGPRIPRARVRLGLVDPDCVLVIDGESRTVGFAPYGDPLPAALVAMGGDQAHLLLEGQLDFDRARAAGDVVLEGSAHLVRWLAEDPHARQWLRTVYDGVLRDAGREDLLLAG